MNAILVWAVGAFIGLLVVGAKMGRDGFTSDSDAFSSVMAAIGWPITVVLFTPILFVVGVSRLTARFFPKRRRRRDSL